jgi:hypothetical protein
MTEQYYGGTRQLSFRSRWRSNTGHNVIPDRQSNGIQRILAEIDRDIEQLDLTIVAEEAATRILDMADVKYSLSARHMRTRRDNLVSTKTALLDRLTSL